MSNLPAKTEKSDISIGQVTPGGLVPSTFEGLYRLAKIMSASGLMPKGVERPEAVFVAVQMGLEVGLSPMQAVQNIAVVNGRPSIWGTAMLGLVRASGQMEEFDEKFEGTPYQDDFKAICTTKRKGAKESVFREFSVKDAKDAGLWTKTGPWQAYKKRMLQMRARGWLLNDVYADILKGLRMAEEVQDYDISLEQGESGVYQAAAEDQPEENPFTADRFDEMAAERLGGEDFALLAEFVAKTAESVGLTADQVKTDAADRMDEFFAAFEAWAAKQPGAQKEPEAAEPEPEDEWAGFRAEWIALREPGYRAYVQQNINRFSEAPQELKKEAFAKWKKLYPGEAWNSQGDQEAANPIPDEHADTQPADEDDGQF